jgi:hypothetical protein
MFGIRLSWDQQQCLPIPEGRWEKYAVAAADTDQSSISKKGTILKAIGTGVITGAADDDPSAIGTYASAGAKFGLSFLWIAPVVYQ